MCGLSLQILINVRDAIASVLFEDVFAHLADSPVSAMFIHTVTLGIEAAGRVLTAVSVTVIPDMSSTIRMTLVKILDHSGLLRQREGMSINRRSTA
jgi:hypothetical protein